MATDLETERANLKMRDTWLENLGKEIDLKELELRKDKERIQSLEQPQLTRPDSAGRNFR